MANITHVELDEYGRPLVSGFGGFAARHLVHVLVMFFCLVPLSLGLHYDEFFIRSPLVKYSSMILGPCASAISWVPAYFFAGIVFGKFHFAKEVFHLYSNNDFSIAIALVVLIAPVAVFLARTLNRTASSYLYRKLLFCAAALSMIAALASTVEYIKALDNPYVYTFSFTVLVAIYFFVLGQDT